MTADSSTAKKTAIEEKLNSPLKPAIVPKKGWFAAAGKDIQNFLTRPCQNWLQLKKVRFIKPWPVFVTELMLIICTLIFFSFIFQDTVIKFSNSHQDIVNGSFWIYLPLFSLIASLGFLFGLSKKRWIEPVEVALPVVLLFWSQHYLLYPSTLPWGYGSAVLVFVTISVIFSVVIKAFKRTNRTSEQNGYLLPDYDLGYTGPVLGEDSFTQAQRLDSESKLGFDAYAKEIADAANLIVPHKAFSIGIDGEWGSGKSSLIALIKGNLLKNKPQGREIEILDFKPWMFDEKKSLIENFFSVWAEQFYHNPEVRNDIRKYVALLSKAESELFKSSLLNFVFDNETDTAAIKQRLETAARASGRIYNFFIDDLDRVEQSEVLEVIRLCKILADFPNTIYFIAYDRAFIDGAIAAITNDKKKQQEYFDKIVQIEFKVPAIVETRLQLFLTKLFEEQLARLALQSPPGQNEIKDALSQEYVPHLLKNIRGVKRFVNVFLLRYKLVHNKVNFQLFFRFELLHFVWKEAYWSLYQRKYELIDCVKDGELNFELFNKKFGVPTRISDWAFKMLVRDLLIFQGKPSSFLNNFGPYFYLSGLQLDVKAQQFDAWAQNFNSNDMVGWLESNTSDLIIGHFKRHLKLKPISIADRLALDEINADRIKQVAQLITELIKAAGKAQFHSPGLKEQFVFDVISQFHKRISDRVIGSIQWDIALSVILEDDEANRWTESILSAGYGFESFPILSDSYTQYLGCTGLEDFNAEISSRRKGPAVEVTHEAWSMANFPELAHSKWISRTEMDKIQWFECDDYEPIFSFERKFYLLCMPSSLILAKLHIIADDICNVSCNGQEVDIVHGFSSITVLDIKQFLQIGLNSLSFNLKNCKISDNKQLSRFNLKSIKDGRSQVKHNPYGLRYHLQLKLYPEDKMALPQRVKYLDN